MPSLNRGRFRFTARGGRFLPPGPGEGNKNDIELYNGHLSHFQKFRILLHSCHKLPAVYQEKAGKDHLAAQQNLDSVFASFLEEMQNNFSSEGATMQDTFWRKMTDVGAAISSVWEAGGCPQFTMLPPIIRFYDPNAS